MATFVGGSPNTGFAAHFARQTASHFAYTEAVNQKIPSQLRDNQKPLQNDQNFLRLKTILYWKEMAKKNPKKLPEYLRKGRLDLSAWLWHFVRRDENPSETLRNIIQDEAIIGSICRPFDKPVVCFTETPLWAHIEEDIDLKSWDYKRLSLYGIGFLRDWLYEQGARPVIYTERNNYNKLTDEFKHLFVEFDLKKGVDFSWQREWRIKTQKFKVDRSKAILVFPDHNEFEDIIYDYYADVDVSDGQVVAYGGADKKWNFIPLNFCETFDYESIIAYIDEDFLDDIKPIPYDDVL